MAAAIPHVPNDILRQEKDAMTNNTTSYYKNHITYASAVIHNAYDFDCYEETSFFMQRRTL